MVRKKSSSSSMDTDGAAGSGDSDRFLSKRILTSWFYDLISAVAHCHSNNILLRSLTSDQIVIDHSGVVKIASLHRAKVCTPKDAHADPLNMALKEKKQNKKMRRSKSSSSDSAPVNPNDAPEMLLGSPRNTFETDMWSLGCLLLQLFIRKPIFVGKDRESLLRSIYKALGTPSKGNFPDAYKYPNFKKGDKKYKKDFVKALRLSDAETDEYMDLIMLIEQMLVLDPALRKSSSQVLNCQFFNDFISNSDSESFRSDFAKDWMKLKASIMLVNKEKEEEELKREQGIKRKAMLMAASSKVEGNGGAIGDDLYDLDDILDVGSASLKKPKL
mmetsp:Transcript_5477/g.16222  ORF Transcript_5477/g.16222 Transcript_5477/m.16222 type:complete len:330 (+) Transcript_5477:1-990(+)